MRTTEVRRRAGRGFDHTYLLDVIQKEPDQFVGVAVVDEKPADLGGHLEALRSRGIVGVRLVTLGLDADSWVDSQGAKNVFQAAANQNITACFLCDPGELSAIDRVCGRYPELTVVIDHLARIGSDGDLNDVHISQLSNLSQHKNVYVKVSAFYALGRKQPPYLNLLPMVRRWRDAFGAERVMWASDCPFQVDPVHTYRDSIELITERAYFLSEQEKLQLLQGTAEKVFLMVPSETDPRSPKVCSDASRVVGPPST